MRGRKGTGALENNRNFLNEKYCIIIQCNSLLTALQLCWTVSIARDILIRLQATLWSLTTLTSLGDWLLQWQFSLTLHRYMRGFCRNRTQNPLNMPTKTSAILCFHHVSVLSEIFSPILNVISIEFWISQCTVSNPDRCNDNIHNYNSKKSV